jgi:hypothetical protein
MNPYASGAFWITMILIVLLNNWIANRIKVQRVKWLLKGLLILGVLIPFIYISFRERDVHVDPKHMYIDSNKKAAQN